MKRFKGELWGGLVVLVVVVIGAAFYLTRGQTAQAEVGDCATDDPFAIVDCADPAADYTVLAVLGGDGECKYVAGANHSWAFGESMVCLGPRGADPQRSMNIVDVGDCLAVVDEQTERTSCEAEDALFEVLAKFTTVSTVTVDSTCDTVEGTETFTYWSWVTDESVANPITTDVVLCLRSVAPVA